MVLKLEKKKEILRKVIHKFHKFKLLSIHFFHQTEKQEIRMKSTLLVSFSFLLLAFAFTKPSTAGDLDATEAVLDTDGEKLRAGAEYYILPVIRGRGGGLTMASTRNESCPLDVVQEPLEISEGLPVTFTPVNPKKGVIRVSTDLNIKFAASSICVQSICVEDSEVCQLGNTMDVRDN
ncbi:hypothetical protein OIU77_021638 [Salix suchowensis]|uniref:Uncharacterized protein n=1 Tax=Salix suchowensis TaxID=1278906 RepID=A0ABQ9CBH6_9ROSI|nr:hypothetical protein OIU77_021638 [Salix suchowensis]